MNHPTTFYIKTFGCQMNYADSEKIHRILASAGLRKVLDPLQADIILLNTCSVRQKGENKVYGFIREIRKHATNEKIIGVTGCMVRKTGIHPRFLEKDSILKGKIPTQIELHTEDATLENADDKLLRYESSIDFVFRIEEVSWLTKLLSIIYKSDIGNDSKFHEYLQVQQYRENPKSANIIIQTGCDNYCSFCIVPTTRGREISRNIEEIFEEVKLQVSEGVREITLLGQNVNSYGKETKKKLWNAEALTWNEEVRTGKAIEKTPFRELLEKLGSIPGLERMRFTSSNPHDMTRDILDAHFEVPACCNYLHFALQSGSNALLRRMNRKHSYEDFALIVKYLRERDPLFSISTDIIVGFPDETEEDFQETVRAFQELDFDFAYIARYSPRPGTLATTRMEDSISHEEKFRRWDILNELLKESVQKRNALMIGRKEVIFISGNLKDGGVVGRTRNFKEVQIQNSKLQIGDEVEVEIIGHAGWALEGKLIAS